jgi:hypothetical protein
MTYTVMNIIFWVFLLLGVCGLGLLFWFIVWTMGDDK